MVGLLIILVSVVARVVVGLADNDSSRRCTAVSLLSSRLEYGQQVSELRIDEFCSCAELSLMVRLDRGGFPLPCSAPGSPNWHNTLLTVPVRRHRAQLHTVVAACYQARSVCRCPSRPSCDVVWGQFSLDGLDFRTWNVHVSVMQSAGPRLSLDALVVPLGELYFPQLELRLYQCSNHSEGCRQRQWRTVRIVTMRPQVHVMFGASDGLLLSSGSYQLELRPANSWVCQGNNNGCRTLVTSVRLQEFRQRLQLSAAAPSFGGMLQLKALCAVTGVILAVILSIFLWRRFARAAGGEHTVGTRLALTSNASVLLVHLWPAPAVALLSGQLRAGGLHVSDCHEPELAALWHTMPVADVLATERLQRARLVVICSEKTATLERSMTPRGSREARFVAIVAWLRNSSLSVDYRRVFVMLATGEQRGMEALVPGCRFLWPEDVVEMVRQISAGGSGADW